MRGYLLTLIGFLLACQGCVHGRLVPPESVERPFWVDMTEGTTWVYEDFDQAPADRESVEVTVASVRWYAYKSISFPGQEVLTDPLRVIQRRYRSRILGKPARLVSSVKHLGSGPWMWVNTEAGLVAVMGRTDPTGYMMVPGRGNPVESWPVAPGWQVADWDTLIVVPAGEFHCLNIHHTSDVVPKRNTVSEFWAPDVGLVRLVLGGPDGGRDWRLVSRRIPPR